MPQPKKPYKDQPNTYFVQDRGARDELVRLSVQDNMLTNGMGGVLPEQVDLTGFQQILDIGCGTGGWLIEVARTCAGVTHLIGVDINEHTIAYAQNQAALHKVNDRVQFQTMDVLKELDFPEKSFDLVNERLGASYLRTWDWAKLFDEITRVTRSGGVVRFTEGETIIESSSSALLQLNQLFVQALYKAGNYFTPESRGVTSRLPQLLSQHGFQNVQVCAHALEYRAGTEQGQAMYEDLKRLFRLILPFLQKWTRVPHNYDELYQQMLHELQQPDFVATWNLLSIWGNRS